MAFYSEIAPYYDYIFPVGDGQMAFIQKHLNQPPLQILDIACGSGGYAVGLAKAGHLVTAIDSDDEMISSAREKADLENVEVALLCAKMDEITQHITGVFDAAICIGNSLVHLDGRDRVFDFLVQLHQVLKDRGRAIIQIINYNRVLFYGQTTLPELTHEGAGLKFSRRYELSDDRIMFHTTLEKDGQKIVNQIPLLPLTKEELENLLIEAGFRIVHTFGGYDGQEYSESESQQLIEVIERD